MTSSNQGGNGSQQGQPAPNPNQPVERPQKPIFEKKGGKNPGPTRSR